MQTKSHIPFCRSEFLQDFSIALGRSNHRFHFTAEVDTCEHDDMEFERLSIWIGDVYAYGTRVNLTLWEDRTIWVSVALLATEWNKEYKVGFYPDAALLTYEQIVDGLFDTAAVATRLCYKETPLPLLRKFWKFTGEAEISGTLKAEAESE